jgi:hypothetical protein
LSVLPYLSRPARRFAPYVRIAKTFAAQRLFGFVAADNNPICCVSNQTQKPLVRNNFSPPKVVGTQRLLVSMAERMTTAALKETKVRIVLLLAVGIHLTGRDSNDGRANVSDPIPFGPADATTITQSEPMSEIRH